MFVRKSKYEELQNEYYKLKSHYNNAMTGYDNAYNLAVEAKRLLDISQKDNSKLRVRIAELITNSKPVISNDDIRSMISLCHPDKHNNSVSSTRITQLLLKLRS